MISVDEKQHILRWTAKKYTGWHTSGRYEIDELINEAWLNIEVRNTQERWKLFIAARWAMLSYMRRQQKSWRQSRIYTHPLINEEGKYIVEPRIIPFNSIDFRDDMERMCHDLTRTEKLVLKLRLEGLPWKQIAKAIGFNFKYSDNHVGQIYVKICALIRIRFKIGYIEAVA